MVRTILKATPRPSFEDYDRAGEEKARRYGNSRAHQKSCSRIRVLPAAALDPEQHSACVRRVALK